MQHLTETKTEVVNKDGFIVGTVIKKGREYFVKLVNGEVHTAQTHQNAFRFFE